MLLLYERELTSRFVSLFRKCSHINDFLKWWYATHKCVTKDLSSDKQTCVWDVFFNIFPLDYLCCNYKHNQKHPGMHQRLDLCDKDSFLDQKLFSKPKQIFVVLHFYNRLIFSLFMYYYAFLFIMFMFFHLLTSISFIPTPTETK